MLRVFIMCNGLRSLLPPTTYNTKAFIRFIAQLKHFLSDKAFWSKENY